MKVWIDQDLCTGDGLCTEIAPTTFVMVDALSYVRDGNSCGLADIPERLLDSVLDAAEECPGECIFIEA